MTLSGNIAGNGGLTTAGKGTVTLGGQNSYAGLTTVSAGLLVINSSSALPPLTTLKIGSTSAAAVQLALGIGQVTIVAVTVNSSSKFDIANNSLAINYGSANDPITSIQAALASGANNVSGGDTWTGNGITSSIAALNAGKFALGYLDGNTDPAALAQGDVQANQFIIQYTLAGDAYLENSVGFDDLVLVAQHYGQTGWDWNGGNFNYDPSGSVGFSDLIAVAQNYGQSSGLSFQSGGQSIVSLSWQDSAVPEPSAVTLIAASGLLARRRNKRRRITD